MGFVVAAVVIAALGGAVGGGVVVMGVVEAFTGRLLINLRQLPWSRRDAEIIGVCHVIQGMVTVAQGVVVALIFATQADDYRMLLPVFVSLMAIMVAAIAVPAWRQIRLSARTGIPLV